MTELAGSFRQSFPEQVAAFRLRLGNLVPTRAWDDIQKAAHDRSFMVAGATKAELLTDFGLAIRKAIEKGTTLEQFRKDFRTAVAVHDWHGWTGEGTKAGEAWRTKVIYRTNLSTTYAAGRMAQLLASGFTLWVYRHGASREPRKQHLAWDGLILPPDHPFWATHAPPNGWGCQCYVTGARSEKGAKRLGGKPTVQLTDDWQVADPRTGAPKGVSKGWDYAPGRSVSETVSLAAKKIAELPPEIGADFGTDMAGIVERSWQVVVADQLLGVGKKPTLVGSMSREVVNELTARGIGPKSAELLIHPELVVAPSPHRPNFAGEDPASADWLALPQLLRKPTAVLIDNQTGQLIFVLPRSSDRAGLVAATIEYVLAQADLIGGGNRIISANRPELSLLVNSLSSGRLSLIMGALL